MNDKDLVAVAFHSALAVLKCPMSVEAKIETLTNAVNTMVPDTIPRLPKTGVEPFDNAFLNHLTGVIQQWDSNRNA